MFRDGIFDNFGEFLDRINESVPRIDEEEIQEQTKSYVVTWQNLDEPQRDFHFVTVDANSELHAEAKAEEILKRDGIPEGFIEIKYVELKESKLQEQERKKAEQTEQPTEETPKDDAERLSMEDWSDTDKGGVPKRVDKVERPTELNPVKDEELSQEVTYERKSDPLYLCNECFKTFRASSPVCKCGSKVVERIGKVKEYQDITDKSPSDYVEKQPGRFRVNFYDGTKLEVEADSKWDAKQKAEKETGKKSAQINPLSSNESKVNETVQELVGETPGINRHAQEILNWAIENKVIPNEWPELQDMIDEVIETDVTDKYSVEDLDQLDLGDIEAVYLKYVLLPQAKKEYKKQDEREPLQWTKEGKEELTAPKVKMSTGQGSSYYADCPNCNTTNWLSVELNTGRVVCKKCGTSFTLGDEIEHEVYVEEIPESKVNEGNWWQELIDQIQKDKKFEKLMSKYGVKSKEVLDYFGRKYWSQTADENSTKAALENVINDLNLEESKLQEQDDVEALRKRRMDIEQKMLDAEKRYQEDQNRMADEVDRLNQQIKAKEGSGNN